MINYRPEMVVGWYHSHPGFGCWLSSVDINTQQVKEQRIYIVYVQRCVLYERKKQEINHFIKNNRVSNN